LKPHVLDLAAMTHDSPSCSKISSPKPIPGNPFAGVKLQASSPAKNPFASITLTSGQDSIPTTAKSTSGDYDSKTKERLAKLDKAWQEHIEINPKGDMCQAIEDYFKYKILIQSVATTKPVRAQNTSVVAKPEPTTNLPILAAPKPDPLPVPATATFSYGLSPPSTTPKVVPSTFSFESAPSAQPTASTSTSAFSFGSSSGTVSSISQAPATFSFASATQNGTIAEAITENNEENEEVQEPTIVEAHVDPDWDLVYTFDAKYYKWVDTAWKSFLHNPVKVERHKVDGLKRMTMRDSMGRVQLNLSIYKGMVFNGINQKKRAIIQFVALQDSTVGPEKFLFQVKPEKLQVVLGELKKMAI
jgi:hypothetical protein